MTTTSGPDVRIGRIDPASDELLDWFAQVRLVFQDPAVPPESWVATRRALYAGQRVRAAWDGDRIVGTFRSWDTALTVPGGGSLTADAISTITVRPTHRRRGVLTALMAHDLADAAGRGTPVAVLIASEGTIYGRFGFGVATEAARWELDVRSAAFRPEALALGAGTVPDVVGPEEFRAAGPDVYARSRRCGDIDRWPSWWDVAAGVAPPHPPGDPSVHVVARGPGGRADGVLAYGLKASWTDRVHDTVVTVDVLHAATPAAYVALWRYLAELDLVATVSAEDRALDEAIGWALRDPRAVRQRSRADFLWTRVLDPAAVLGSRRYEAPGTVVLEVTDPRGWAAGRFGLEVGADGGATCAPTTAAADVELPVETLGACWLGGADLAAAATAGRARELRAGALPRTAALLRTTPAPWSSTWF